MGFVIQWLSCLVAFVAGSAAALVLVTRVIKPADPQAGDAAQGETVETGPLG